MRSIVCATGPICRTVSISPSESQRVSDTYDEAPNAWIFGIICRRRTLQFYPPPRPDVGMADVLYDRIVRRYSPSRLDQRRGFRRSGALRGRPGKGQRFPELPYLAVRLGYLACDHFNADTGLAMVRTDHQAFYRRVFLSETHRANRGRFRAGIKTVVLTGVRFPRMRATRYSARFPIMRSSAFERRMLFERSASARLDRA